MEVEVERRERSSEVVFVRVWVRCVWRVVRKARGGGSEGLVWRVWVWRWRSSGG